MPSATSTIPSDRLDPSASTGVGVVVVAGRGSRSGIY